MKQIFHSSQPTQNNCQGIKTAFYLCLLHYFVLFFLFCNKICLYIYLIYSSTSADDLAVEGASISTKQTCTLIESINSLQAHKYTITIMLFSLSEFKLHLRVNYFYQNLYVLLCELSLHIS